MVLESTVIPGAILWLNFAKDFKNPDRNDKIPSYDCAVSLPIGCTRLAFLAARHDSSDILLTIGYLSHEKVDYYRRRGIYWMSRGINFS